MSTTGIYLFVRPTRKRGTQTADKVNRSCQ